MASTWNPQTGQYERSGYNPVPPAVRQQKIEDAFRLWQQMQQQQMGYYGQLANDNAQRIQNSNAEANLRADMERQRANFGLNTAQTQTQIAGQEAQNTRYIQQLDESLKREQNNQVQGLYDSYTRQYGYR